jgi:hypothetical protein
LGEAGYATPFTLEVVVAELPALVVVSPVKAGSCVAETGAPPPPPGMVCAEATAYRSIHAATDTALRLIIPIFIFMLY